VVRMPKVPDGWFDAEPDFLSEKCDQSPVTNGQSESEKAIGPVVGYPEMGRDAWRAANDGAILSATGKFNNEHGYQPDDPRHVSPQMMKSWMMQESGGDRGAFESDPFQVNHPGDWVPEKANEAGLVEGQIMTPQTSAEAALKWLRFKGSVHDSRHNITSYRGNRAALMGYNGRNDLIDGIPFKLHYAETILNKMRNSYGKNRP